ncbi:Signal transduction response regulator, receiver domain [Moorella glycerini]|uniref:Stage 0 sporulation protein A homolog n=1 Tax=Neomoorella stamsii TaxID=1266720 RepID=A0A9X7P613_9FIRM|nr:MULTISPECIES: response regulator transcription factor [Moorella]PRR72237.1 Transcriptional regulatory protein SrrA [Moorella stamsii]CEP69538.1 Signal transduction response regulator, receiver domain [Moorella glycerini]
MEKLRILVADDEAGLRQLVRLYLEKEGMVVAEAATGRQALEKLQQDKYDLLILDLMMPDGDGWSVCREVRQKMDLPIIMLTARGEEMDRLLGFELGADDYVIKPFSPRELVARVKALLRRAGAGLQRGEELQFPGLSIDIAGREVKVDGRAVNNLTPKEFDLLLFLARHPGQVMSREKILEKVWGYDFYGDLRTVDTHIKNLREKLGRERGFITTVWGVGYKFEVGP